MLHPKVHISDLHGTYASFVGVSGMLAVFMIFQVRFFLKFLITKISVESSAFCSNTAKAYYDARSRFDSRFSFTLHF